MSVPLSKAKKNPQVEREPQQVTIIARTFTSPLCRSDLVETFQPPVFGSVVSSSNDASSSYNIRRWRKARCEFYENLLFDRRDAEVARVFLFLPPPPVSLSLSLSDAFAIFPFSIFSSRIAMVREKNTRTTLGYKQTMEVYRSRRSLGFFMDCISSFLYCRECFFYERRGSFNEAIWVFDISLQESDVAMATDLHMGQTRRFDGWRKFFPLSSLEMFWKARYDVYMIFLRDCAQVRLSV